MNRAERRRLAKSEQKKATEKTLAIKPSEFAKFEEQTMQNAVDAYFDFTATCFAYALHSELGFGAKRVERVMQKVNETYGKMWSVPDYYHQVTELLHEANINLDTVVLK